MMKLCDELLPGQPSFENAAWVFPNESYQNALVWIEKARGSNTEAPI